ncbi:MAG: hypothetical protein UY99_C0024G0008 [Parcubacteria group bacterium GW2011_GWA1_59_11]|nr:MAG: hypothetical protein UY99_C0024G0008 [Parcubacteria group bacterium GW2011_GWA1_59_11]
MTEHRLEPSVGMRLEVQQALQLCGGATESCFPEVEAWFMQHADRQRAVQEIAHRKNIDRYRSLIDFLLCEIFTMYRPACFRFYRDKGPRLIEMISVETRQSLSDGLQKAAEIAYRAHCERRRLTWPAFVHEVLAAAA